MEYEFKKSFDRSIKRLKPARKEKLKKAVTKIINFFDTGQKPFGLGLKHIGKNYYEVRIDIKERLIFSKLKNKVTFLIAGNHDEIREFLKKY